MTQKIVLDAITGAPFWVWAIFTYLIFVGIKATKPSNVHLLMPFILPLVLTGLKYDLFMNGPVQIWIAYFLCLLGAGVISFKITRAQSFDINKEKMRVHLPGTYTTLFILIVFFVLKFIFGYIEATNPTLYQSMQIVELSITGIFSGFLLGKSTRYLKAYVACQ